MYVTKAIEKLVYEKQIEVYQKLIEGFTSIPKVVNRFDGKVLNIRFEKAISETLTADLKDIEYQSYIRNQQIKLRYRKAYPDGSGSGCFYPEYSEQWAKVVVSPDGRINAEQTNADIHETIKQLVKSRDELQAALDNLETLQAEYDAICQQIRDFNNKWAYPARQNYRFDRVY